MAQEECRQVLPKQRILLLKLPKEAISRLSAPVAQMIIENYLNEDDSNPDKAILFFDQLSQPAQVTVSSILANDSDFRIAVVGCHGLNKFKNYERLNRQGANNIAYHTMNRIDEHLASKLAKLFFYDASLKNPPQGFDDEIVDAVMHLLHAPSRFDNFSAFLKYFVDHSHLPRRYQIVAQTAEDLLSKKHQ